MSRLPDSPTSTDSLKKHLLYITPEPWPTFRADILVLFGKYLPRFGVTCDLVTDGGIQNNNCAPWPAGNLIGWESPKNRAAYHILKFIHSIRTLAAVDRRSYNAIQVRNMPVHAALALLIARWKGIPVFYWMSFPKHEGQIASARARGIRAGLRYWFPLIQGTIGRVLLFKFVLPFANHVFVQSQTMQDELALAGILREKLTPVPMGVDMQQAKSGQILPMDDERLFGKDILVYLGTLNGARQIEKLFEMLALVRASEPNTLLVLVGDADDQDHREWLQAQAERWGVARSVVWTGWVSTEVAWRYVRAAKVGLSPFPRGTLLDSASPTKAIEYLALGVPVVVNDNPDQEKIVRESGAGICVEYLPTEFAAAVLRLLRDDALRAYMADRGRQYVAMNRDYLSLAEALAAKYRKLL